jgi:hypothetical protein
MVGIETTRRKCDNPVRSEITPNPVMRRYKTQMAHLRGDPRSKGFYYADIMEPKIKSIDSQRYAYESFSNEAEE